MFKFYSASCTKILIIQRFFYFPAVHRICNAIYYPRVALCPGFPAREESGAEHHATNTNSNT